MVERKWVWLVYVDVGKGWELRVIASSESKSKDYSRAFRGMEHAFDLRPKIHIEQCEIDHAFGASMIDLPFGYLS